MQPNEHEEFELVPRIMEILRGPDAAAAAAALVASDPSDVRRFFSEAAPEVVDELFIAADPAHAAVLAVWLAPEQAASLVERLPDERAAAIVSAMPSDERADLLAAVEDDERLAIESQMSAAKRDEAERLIAYAPDSAGGLMETEFLSYPADITVSDAIRDIRANQEKYTALNVQYVYIVDADRRLVGIVSVRDLLLSPEQAPLRQITRGGPVRAAIDTTSEDLADLFLRTGFIGLPVVDGDGRLVGVVNRADLLERIEETTSEQFRRSQGIVGGEELRTMPVAERTIRRLQWLGVNILLCFGGAAIVAWNQDMIATAIILAAFLPVISAMSGNAAMQAATVSMRELTLGIIVADSWRMVLRKELLLAVFIGAAMGTVLSGVALAWGGSGRIGLVLGLAMSGNTLIAICIGSLVPLILRRFRADPALATGPITTTITDITGFGLTLGLARVLL